MDSIYASQEQQLDVIASLEALRSDDPVIREKARNVLITAGSAAVVPLAQSLKDPADHVCWEAAKALGAIGDPAAASALVETLEHPNHDVRWVAAEALPALGRDGLKQVLMALLTKSGSSWVQKSAHHALAKLADHKSGYFLKPLLEKFDAFEPGVAIPPAALRALYKLEKQESLNRKG